MKISPSEISAILAAVCAILSLGSLQLGSCLCFYSLQTFLLGLITLFLSWRTGQEHLIAIAALVIALKALGVPLFLAQILKKLQAPIDTGMYLPAPLAMHLSVLLLGASYLLSKEIPGLHGDGDCHILTASAMSILFSGVLLMLTRRLAVSQILGFLAIENGVYLFALAQTRGMPLLVEMGFMLELLVAVMISGLLLFNIQKSFEHMDISQLTELQDRDES